MNASEKRTPKAQRGIEDTKRKAPGQSVSGEPLDLYTQFRYALHIILNRRLEGRMRTNIVIDDQLMQQAMQVTGLRTKKSVVEAGLQLLVRAGSRAGLRGLWGKVQWEGDLDETRQRRHAPIEHKPGD